MADLQIGFEEEPLDSLFPAQEVPNVHPNFMGDIKDFHEKYGLAYDGKPRMLPPDMASFRHGFMLEEINEWKEQGDTFPITSEFHMTQVLEGQLDALVDELYVVLGTAYQQGFGPEIFNEAWRRVHAANMAKVRCERPGDSKRGSTFDVIKPEGWKAPSHTDLVCDHAHQVKEAM